MQNNQLDTLLLKAESYSHFILENQRRSQTMLVAKNKSPSENAEGAAVFEQPPNLVGGKLMPYQLEGLQWLLSLWENGLNGILADEMGLGKTIQIIALIAHLRSCNTSGPYMIAGPLATISNWVREFQKWLPDCPVILYHGSKEEREALRKKHMPVNNAKSLSFPIVITSFEICIIDRPHLERYVWQYIILDEGHRIKNRNCRLIRELKSIKSISRLLLTGTPIQNSLEELWSLLNFCSPMIFDDLEVFQSWFDFKNIGQDTKVEDILSTEETNRIVSKMHEILRPFVLRRLKKETLGEKLPPKREIVVYCGMSALQREYYARVLDGTLRNSLVDIGVEGAKKVSQINVLMNLRKVCNHPFLFGDIQDEASGQLLRDVQKGLLLTHASGKFKLLHRMLPQFKKNGHKVLIFSQMTKLLDLLEDYMIHQDHKYVRFDGSTKLAERQEYIDTFNDPTSNTFVFLLSTRAGGLGINLTSADTVILFDSDWNPHQDSQAQDRCHRIGQSKPVVIYRLLTTGSVEIEMMKKQISKKKLERLAMTGGDFRKAGRRLGRGQSLHSSFVASSASEGKEGEDVIVGTVAAGGFWSNLPQVLGSSSVTQINQSTGGQQGRLAQKLKMAEEGPKNTVTLEELRVLMEDDVKGLDKRGQGKYQQLAQHSNKKVEGGDADGEDEEAPELSMEEMEANLRRDISDAELRDIMDRKKLFPHIFSKHHTDRMASQKVAATSASSTAAVITPDKEGPVSGSKRKAGTSTDATTAAAADSGKKKGGLGAWLKKDGAAAVPATVSTQSLASLGATAEGEALAREILGSEFHSVVDLQALEAGGAVEDDEEHKHEQDVQNSFTLAHSPTKATGGSARKTKAQSTASASAAALKQVEDEHAAYLAAIGAIDIPAEGDMYDLVSDASANQNALLSLC